MAVIKRTECFFESLQGIVLFFVVLLLVVCGAEFALANPRGCQLVRNDVQVKGFSGAMVNDRPTTGPICGADSCCNENLEKDMINKSQLYLEKFLREAITKVSSIIDTRARKFDDFFQEMMNNSKRDFHKMFEKTYGKIYLQNSDVFSEFFNELETYYRKGTVRLSETLDTFFVILYQRMFTVINAQYQFDEKYLECVSEHMSHMKPFGDLPTRLSVQLRRSFVATRTFYKALVKGAAAASSLMNIKVDEECKKELTKMQYCGVCKGEQDSRACSDYCVGVVEACLKYDKEFNTVWDNFVDAIDKVAERLLGPYNIEVVVEPLNVKISEAIMTFQEVGADVSQKIYTLCGKPSLNRPKRKSEYVNPAEDNRNYEIKIDPMKLNNGSNNKKKHKKIDKNVDNTPSIDKLISDIKQKVKDTKRYWAQLPYQYCNNDTISAPPSERTCHNGTISPHLLNRHESQIINDQVFILQGLTEKLRRAHQGQEVEMVDDTEEPLAGSGSGSGDGDFEDDEDGRSVDIDRTIDEGDPIRLPTPTTTPSSTRTPEVILRTSSSASSNTMSLTRALLHYLLPIVLAWFGGAISDLL